MTRYAAIYQQAEKDALDGRELESAVLVKAAQRLKACSQRWDAMTTSSAEELADALRHNQRLWTVLQVDLSREDHPLPVDLRRSLLQLSHYIDRTTMSLLADPVKSRLDSLVNINLQIAEGLRVHPAAAGAVNHGSRQFQTAGAGPEGDRLDLDI